MIFSQAEFIPFILLLMGLLFLVRRNIWRKVFILAASYYFYACWDYRFILLIIIISAIGFYGGLALEKSQTRWVRKSILWGGIMASLGILGYFKYYNFFIESLQSWLGHTSLGWTTLSIILPVGISFYTFECISYLVDVYQKKIKVCHSTLDYAIFSAFFPRLVAGPIVRASEFLPQLESYRAITANHLKSGFKQFVYGFAKKVFIADNLGQFVDVAFDSPALFDTTSTWLYVIAFGIQIYCDFSGYSDMAIGISRMMGYELNPNFNLPYLATSPAEFWHRWHISLSTWLRDYLYIPLGGNRHGEVRTWLHLMLTMLLGGLWHGASWNFLIWGGFHGGALVVQRWTVRYWPQPINPVDHPALVVIRKIVGWGVTMLVVLVGWVFFRAADFTEARMVLHKMFVFQSGLAWIYPFALLAVGVMLLQHLLVISPWRRWVNRDWEWWYPAVLMTAFLISLMFKPDGFHPFIYFQF